MIGISSRSAGVLLLPKPGTSKYAILDVIEGKEQDPIDATYLYSATQDWEKLQGNDQEELVKKASHEYWLTRAVSLIREVIGGLESSLEEQVVEHVEELLSSRVSSEETLNRLLIAPLENVNSLGSLSMSALSHGFTVVGSILDELKELQPLLKRFTNFWLSLDEAVFIDFTETRKMIWLKVVEKCYIVRLLKMRNGNDFKRQWNLLAFCYSDHQSRIGVNTLAHELSKRLFPQKVGKDILKALALKEDISVTSHEEGQEVNDHKTYKGVKKQIAAISDAVSQGSDAKAEKFLRELVDQQTSISGKTDNVVKSLCNIAQRCADMFRMDFERFCLEKALQLKPSDSWTLIQYGDHLKRIGQYDDALKILTKAESIGNNIVASANIADVLCHQGRYEESIQFYQSIPKWDGEFSVRIAIADNLRRMGHMEESEDIYKELIHLVHNGLIGLGDSDLRAQVGLAEIAKKRGNLEDTMQIYREILKRNVLNDRDKCIYKLAQCNVLKLMDEYDAAFTIADEIVQKYPFAIEARFIRGSILGLLGRDLEGLKDVPESSSSRSFREWLRRYYRGLLLLKLERYEDAKKNLVEELPRAIASGEHKAILRMGAALWYLSIGETVEADKILADITILKYGHEHYLTLVLKLHLATQKKDLTTIRSLKEQIDGLKLVNLSLANAVDAVSARKFSLALIYETEALLKLAA